MPIVREWNRLTLDNVKKDVINRFQENDIKIYKASAAVPKFILILDAMIDRSYFGYTLELSVLEGMGQNHEKVVITYMLNHGGGYCNSTAHKMEERLLIEIDNYLDQFIKDFIKSRR